MLLAASLAAGAVGAAGAAGPTLVQQVYTIEAGHGNDPQKVIELLRPLEAAARSEGGPGLLTFLAAWGYAHGSTNKPAVADAAIEEMTGTGERLHDPSWLASAYTLKASMLSFSGQRRDAFGWIETALPLVEHVENPDLHYWMDMTGGDLATGVGHLDEGLRLFTAAVTDAQASRNPRREAQAVLAITPLLIVRAEYTEALANARRIRELGARSTDPSLVASGWVMEVFAAEAAGLVDRAARARREAVAAQVRDAEAVNATGDEGIAAQSNAWLASEIDAASQFAGLYSALGNYAAARRFAERTLAAARSERDDHNAALAQVEMGIADLGLDRVAAGRAELDAGLDALRGQQHRADLLVQLNRATEMLERAGEHGAALERLREALLLENELERRDHESLVLTLQRQSSFEQHQRHLEQLEHENALQGVEIERRRKERLLTLLLVAAMAIGSAGAWRQYARARRSNRQLAANNAELAFASRHDRTTGLPNRRAMETDIEAPGAGPYAAVSIAVKQFGGIVGSVGHQLGDTLLCQIADRLDLVVRAEGGVLYRLDGVSFGAVFRGPREGRREQALLARLARAADAPFNIGNQDLIVALALGAAAFPEDAGSAQEVARLAELAKLEVQGEPGSTWRVYDARIGEHQRDKLTLESRMLKALELGHFELFYQGQRALPDGRICGFEALLRWRDGETMVSPAQFIPLAEETGLIVKIGAWVLREACRQARAWADSGAGRPLVAVNISPRQFNHPDFLATVRETLRTTGVDPRQIELEITEGSVMNDAEASIAQLHALRALGLHLAIDDFGTGYASLSYLRRFPLDRLKIDRSFIKQLDASAQDDTIVRTVIELAHSLGLSVTAEGVETLDQERKLEGWGCDVIQGFLRFRPVPAVTATGQLVDDARLVDAQPA